MTHHFYIPLVLLPIVMAACSSDTPEATSELESEAFSSHEGREPLTLCVPTISVRQSSSASRGYLWGIESYERLLEDYNHIGMFACNTRHPDFDKETSKVGNYIRNLHYEPIDKDGTYWHGNPQAWWPLDVDDNLTFFCYAPYDREQEWISDQRYHDNWTGKFVLEYKVKPAPEEQLDFCVVQPITNLSLRELHDLAEGTNGTDPDPNYADYHLPFTLHHALTWVTFYARYMGQLPYPINRCFIYEIKLEDIITRKLLTFHMNNSTTMDGSKENGVSTDFCTWTDDDDEEIKEDDYGNFTITHEVTSHLHTQTSLNRVNDVDDEIAYDSDNKEVTENEGYVELLNNGGWLYMIPQVIKKNQVKLTITFQLRTSNDDINDDIAMSYVTRETYLPESEWLPGKQMRYYINIDLTPMSELIIEPVQIDWIDGHSYGDPEDPETPTDAGDSSMHIE